MHLPSMHVQVGQLEERLAELEAERAELAAFQAADAQRRSLEYAIYDREASDARAKLVEVRHARCLPCLRMSCPHHLVLMPLPIGDLSHVLGGSEGMTKLCLA